MTQSDGEFNAAGGNDPRYSRIIAVFLSRFAAEAAQRFPLNRRAKNSPPWRKPSASMPWPMPGGQMPFDRHAERGQPLRRLEQRLRRNEVVAVAVDEQHRRARFYLGGEGFDVRRPAARPRGRNSRRSPQATRRGAARHAAPSWCPG